MKKLFILLLCLPFLMVGPTHAKKINPSRDTLKVGVVLVPPFVMRNNERYYGVAADIWREIATKNDWKYHFVEYQGNNYDEAVAGLTKGDYDVLVGPTSVTLDRETIVDFSHPFYLDSVGVVIKRSLVSSVMDVIEMFLFSTGSLILVLLLLFGIYVHIIWYFERRHEKQIPKSYRKGIEFVIWNQLSGGSYFSAPPQNTGPPASPHARFSLIFWIMATYVLTTLISGSVVSFMTVSLTKYADPITSTQDLQQSIVAAVPGSRAYSLGKKMGLKVQDVNGFKDGMKLLEKDKISAYITDQAIAEYNLKDVLNPSIALSPITIRYDFYSFAVPQESPLLHKINRTLLALQKQDVTLFICKEYLTKGIRNCQL